MDTHLDRVDHYISDAEPFARPILEHIRDAFHAACPEVSESIKWGFPHFSYQGLLGSMSAHKRHVRFGFWKGSLIEDSDGLFGPVGKTAMNALKVSSVDELPSLDRLAGFVRQAIRLNEDGIRPPGRRDRAGATRHSPLDGTDPPADLAEALASNPRARATFESFSPSAKREYVEWITEAKREETRLRRLRQAVEWMAEGKPRNWKYMR